MKIFISYRRQDSEWVSLSIFKSLQEQFPNDSIFKDFHIIKAGDNFIKTIESNLQSCDVFLVVIGTEWLDCKDDDGNQRLFNSNDVVCLEIATAILKGKKVIPVLVNNTQMPTADKLPESIKELHNFQAVRINNSNFEMDIFNLANSINESVGKRNQYADLVKDIATGKVSHKELEKPETNSAYAIVCICLGLLILFLNSDSIPVVLICIAMVLLGAYAYFLSKKVKPNWLNKNFEKARQDAKSAKLISLITPVIGIILIFIVILLLGLKTIVDPNFKKTLDSLNVVINPKDSIKPSVQKVVSVPIQPVKIDNTQIQYNYIVTQNSDIYSSPNANDVIDILFEGSRVCVIETQYPFTKVGTTLQDGTYYTFWISSDNLSLIE